MIVAQPDVRVSEVPHLTRADTNVKRPSANLPSYRHIDPAHPDTGAVKNLLRRFARFRRTALESVKTNGQRYSSLALNETRATNRAIMATPASPVTKSDVDRIEKQIFGLLQFNAWQGATDVLKSGFDAAAEMLGLPSENAHKTIPAMVAGWLDLSDPHSLLNAALADHSADLAAPAPLSKTGRALADHDMALKLACAILDKAMTPDRDTVETQLAIVERIGAQLTKECEDAHAKGLQACLDHLASIDDDRLWSDKTQAELRKICERTAKTIDSLTDAAFKRFQAENGAPIGYTRSSARLGEAAGVEFYKAIFKYTAASAALGFTVTAPLGSIPHAGPALAAITGFFTGYAANVVSQIGARSHATMGADAQPLAPDPKTSPRPQFDMDPRQAEKAFAKSLETLAQAASMEISNPDSRASRQARHAVADLKAKGYGAELLGSVGDELQALAELLDLQTPGGPKAFSGGLAPSLKVARMLHAARASLPDLSRVDPSRGPDADQRRALLAAILHASQAVTLETKPSDNRSLIQAVERRAAHIRAERGDRPPSTIDDATLFCGSAPIQAVQETIAQATQHLLGPAFSASQAASASHAGFRSLFVTSLISQVGFGLLGTAAVAASAIYGGPPAALAASMLTSAASYAAGAPSREFSARQWHAANERANTHNLLHQILTPHDTNPLLSPGDRKKIREARVSLVRHLVGPQYPKVQQQLKETAGYLITDLLSKTAENQYEQATNMLAALTSMYGGQKNVADLAGRQLTHDRKLGSSAKRSSLLDDTQERAQTILDMTENLKSQLGLDPAAANRLDWAAGSAIERIHEPYGVVSASRHRARYQEHYKLNGHEPAEQAAITSMRADVRDMFDAYLRDAFTDPKMMVSRAELESLETFLRKGFTDDATEAWIAKIRATVGSRLDETSDACFHLDFVSATNAMPQKDRVAALRKNWTRLAEENGERVHCATQIVADVVNFFAGKYDSVTDRQDFFLDQLKSRSAAMSWLRTVRASPLSGFFQGVGLDLSVLVSTNVEGHLALLLNGALAGIGLAGTFDPSFMNAVVPQVGAGLFPTPANSNGGLPINVLGAIRGPFASFLPGVVNPAAGAVVPLSVAASANANYAGQPSDVLLPSMNRIFHAIRSALPSEMRQRWGGEALDPGAIALGLTSVGSVAARRGQRLRDRPDDSFLPAGERETWRAAIRNARPSKWARIFDGLQPRRIREQFKARHERKWYGKLLGIREKHNVGPLIAATAISRAAHGIPVAPQPFKSDRAERASRHVAQPASASEDVHFWQATAAAGSRPVYQPRSQKLCQP